MNNERLESLLLPPSEREGAAFLGTSSTSEESELKIRKRAVAEQSRYLFKLNLIVGLIHGLTAALMFLLIYVAHARRQSYAIYTSFPEILDHTRGRIGQPDLHSFGKLRINVVSAAYLTLEAVQHLLVALPLRRSYETMLTRNQNPFRWVIYSFALPLIRIQIAVLCGVRDVHTLWGLFGLAHASILFVLLFSNTNGDRRNRGQRVRWTPLQLAFIPHVFSWATILCYFFHTISNDGKLEGFVWAAVLFAFLLDMMLAANTILQYSAYNDFLKGELGFAVLSVVSKQLLTWIIFGGKAK